MVIIKYESPGYVWEYNHETDQAKKKEVGIPTERECKTQAEFNANYPIAEREAIPGTIEVSGEFDPEPETPETGNMVTWSELNGAYEAGYDEGYTEGVNSVYD